MLTSIFFWEKMVFKHISKNKVLDTYACTSISSEILLAHHWTRVTFLLQMLPNSSRRRMLLLSNNICALGQQASACLHACHISGAPSLVAGACQPQSEYYGGRYA
jgi:hypothetical protein